MRHFTMVKVFDSERKLSIPGYQVAETYLNLNTQEYDAIAPSYREVTAVHAAQEHVHIDMGIRFSKTECRVVADLGCAFGRDVDFWIGRGFEYHGIDSSKAMLELARADHPDGEFIHGDFVTTPLIEGSCGLVWASSSLQHVPRQFLPYVLANAAQALVPGGIFYANYRPPKEGVPMEGFLISTEYKRSDTGDSHVNRFTAHFDRDVMIELLQQAGLEIVEGRDYDEIYGSYNAEKAQYLPKKEIVFARKS